MADENWFVLGIFSRLGRKCFTGVYRDPRLNKVKNSLKRNYDKLQDLINCDQSVKTTCGETLLVIRDQGSGGGGGG